MKACTSMLSKTKLLANLTVVWSGQNCGLLGVTNIIFCVGITLLFLCLSVLQAQCCRIVYIQCCNIVLQCPEKLVKQNAERERASLA